MLNSHLFPLLQTLTGVLEPQTWTMEWPPVVIEAINVNQPTEEAEEEEDVVPIGSGSDGDDGATT